MSALPEALQRSADRITATFAAAYDGCPHSAMLDKQLGAVGYQLHRGTIAHDFATRVTTFCVGSGQRWMPTDAGHALMVRLIGDSDEPINTEEQDMLLELAETFCVSHEFDADSIVDMEAEYATTVDGSVQIRPGQPREPFSVLLVGKPDLIERSGSTLTVTDYKTAYGVEPESKISGTFQGRVYGLLGLDAFPDVETVRLRWDYLRFGERGIREAEIHRDQAPALREYLSLRAAKIVKSRARNSWPAIPGSWCSRCPATERCPKLKADGRIGVPIDRAGAQAYADSILAAEALIKDRKKGLRAYVVEHGQVTSGDQMFDLSLGKDSYRIDDDAREAMERAGIDWKPFAQRQKGSTSFRHHKLDAGGGK